MAAPATTAVPGGRAAGRAEALARLWARVRLPLVAAPVGGLVGAVGCYLYWTVSTVRVEGVPLTGELVNYGFGGVRRWALLLAVGSLAYGAYLLTRRSALTVRRAEALARLGIGLAVLAGLWVMTLILFLESSLDRVGPGPWVTLAGGVLVWLAARGQLTAPAGAAPAEWPRRSAAWDLAVVVVAELLAYLAFLVTVAWLFLRAPRPAREREKALR